jgi:hypothetical protein
VAVAVVVLIWRATILLADMAAALVVYIPFLEELPILTL